MGTLATLFGSPEDKEQDSDKLMDLYWNRAELKKSFADARTEHFRLQDRIKQQEGATARIQQKLDQIEGLLGDSESAHSVVAYYQLRGLALRCEDRLAVFAEQLKQQREKKQHDGMMSDWQAKLAVESAQVEEQLLVQRSQMKQVEDDLLAKGQTLESMGGIKKLFKGRSVKADLKMLQRQIESIRGAEQSLLADLSAINARTPPETQGLDVANKRSINLLILAFAQQLYLYFVDKDFAKTVKEAGDKSAGAMSYGNQYECARLLEQIQKHIEIMDQAKDIASTLKKRAKLIGERASFTGDTVVVPAPGSTTTVFDIDDNGIVRENNVSILEENYWRIANVLTR